MTEPAPAAAPPADWLSRAASALADDWRKLAGHCPGCGSPEPRLHPRDALGFTICPDPYHGATAPPIPPTPAQPETIITPEEPVFDFTLAKNALGRLEDIGEQILSMAEKFAATQEGQDLLAAAHAILLAEDPVLAAQVTTIVGTLVPAHAQPATPAVAAALVTNQG